MFTFTGVILDCRIEVGEFKLSREHLAGKRCGHMDHTDCSLLPLSLFFTIFAAVYSCSVTVDHLCWHSTANKVKAAFMNELLLAD